jgi:hypothetical protein
MEAESDEIYITEEVISCPFGVKHIFPDILNRIGDIFGKLPFQENDSNIPDYSELSEYE